MYQLELLPAGVHASFHTLATTFLIRSVVMMIMKAILIIITWTGCWSDLTASAAEIEPTLDRWTGRPGSGPEHFNDDEEDDDGNSEDDESFGDGGDNIVLILKMSTEELEY